MTGQRLFAVAVTMLRFSGPLRCASGGDHFELCPNPIRELAAEHRLREKSLTPSRIPSARASRSSRAVIIMTGIRQSPFGLKGAADLEAIHVGHHQVEQDDVHGCSRTSRRHSAPDTASIATKPSRCKWRARIETVSGSSSAAIIRRVVLG